MAPWNSGSTLGAGRAPGREQGPSPGLVAGPGARGRSVPQSPCPPCTPSTQALPVPCWRSQHWKPGCVQRGLCGGARGRGWARSGVATHLCSKGPGPRALPVTVGEGSWGRAPGPLWDVAVGGQEGEPEASSGQGAQQPGRHAGFQSRRICLLPPRPPDTLPRAQLRPSGRPPHFQPRQGPGGQNHTPHRLVPRERASRHCPTTPPNLQRTCSPGPG